MKNVQVQNAGMDRRVLPVKHIVTHAAPHSDELRAVWMARRWGRKQFPGIQNADIILVDAGSQPPRGLSVEHWERQGYLATGVWFGAGDEHGLNAEKRKAHCAATLMADRMGIQGDTAIAAILKQEVPTDRSGSSHAFDLSSLIKAWHTDGLHINQVISLFTTAADAQYAYLGGTLGTEPDPQVFKRLALSWLAERTNFRETDAKSALELARQLRVSGTVDLSEFLDFSRRVIKPGTVPWADLEGIAVAMEAAGETADDIRNFVYLNLDIKWRQRQRYEAAIDEFQIKGSFMTVGAYEVAFIESDNDQMNRAVRHGAPEASIMVQRKSNGHTMIFDQHHRGGHRMPMRPIIKRIREAEWKAKGRTKPLPLNLLISQGTTTSVPEWHLFEGNDIFNGTVTAPNKPKTRLTGHQVMMNIKDALEWVQRKGPTA